MTVAPRAYTLGILIIGNEILSGRTHDANTQWIAEKLASRGVAVREVRIVPDEEDMIVEAVDILRRRYDYLITTGGIGPTHDDITAACVAKALGVPLVEDPAARARLEVYYGGAELTPARLKMACVPEGSLLIDNPVSAAPGFHHGNVFVLAGVPRIMQAMLDHVTTMMAQGSPLLSNTVACGLMESGVADDLSALQDRYPEVAIGSYPHYRGGVLGLSIVLRALDNKKLHAATGELLEIIRRHGDEPRAISMMSVSE